MWSKQTEQVNYTAMSIAFMMASNVIVVYIDYIAKSGSSQQDKQDVSSLFYWILKSLPTHAGHDLLYCIDAVCTIATKVIAFDQLR